MVDFALKRPITIIVLFLGLLLFSAIAIFTIPIDIFPKLNSPTIYVIEPYGGMSARQMEGFFATRMQDQFLYITGVKNIQSKNIQGLTLLQLTFYENTDMAEASAQVALQVARAQNFFPPGAVPPQVIRFDASSLPVGELVFSSKTRPLKDIYDLATTRIRPMFATVPGLSAPPPMGANARTLLMNIDPQKLRSYNITPDEVVQAIVKNNILLVQLTSSRAVLAKDAPRTPGPALRNVHRLIHSSWRRQAASVQFLSWQSLSPLKPFAPPPDASRRSP